MRALCLSLLLSVVTLAMAQAPEWAVGLCGESLKEAVGMHCSPTSVLSGSGLWSALLEVDTDKEKGGVVNRFGKKSFQLGEGGVSGDGMTMIAVADKSWWMPDDARLSTLSGDMHIQYPCDESVLAARKDYMPAVSVDKVLYDGEVWKTGEDSDKQGVWTFPASYSGEFARAMLYMACVYSSDIWVGAGAVFMEAGKYPSLSKGALEMLLSFHSGQAPDNREIARCEAVAALQGNANPFVLWPDLADHIWGEKRDVPYGGSDDEPEMKPLRGVYRLSDGTVDVVSPFVPDDAVWTIDGAVVDGKRVPVESLERGRHELGFKAGTCRGKMVILIAD